MKYGCAYQSWTKNKFLLSALREWIQCAVNTIMEPIPFRYANSGDKNAETDETWYSWIFNWQSLNSTATINLLEIWSNLTANAHQRNKLNEKRKRKSWNEWSPWNWQVLSGHCVGMNCELWIVNEFPFKWFHSPVWSPQSTRSESGHSIWILLLFSFFTLSQIVCIRTAHATTSTHCRHVKRFIFVPVLNLNQLWRGNMNKSI